MFSTTILRHIAVAICLMAALLANGAVTTFTSGQYTYTVIGDGKVKVEPADRDMITSATVVSNVRYGGSLYQVTQMSFGSCPNLRSISVGSMYITRLESGDLSNCPVLTSVNLSEDITEIGSYAFRDCSSLKELVIPASVTEIGWSAFNGCSSLKELVIPASVKKIGAYFIEGTQISSIRIPKGVEYLDSRAFSAMLSTTVSNLRSIEVEDGHPFFYAVDGVLYMTDKQWDREILVYYPEGKTAKDFTLNMSYINFPENKYIERLTVDGKINEYIKCEDCDNYITSDLGYWRWGYSHAIKLSSLKHVTIGASYDGNIYLPKDDNPNLETVDVDPENKKYVKKDGLLYINSSNPNEGTKTWKLRYVLPEASAIKTYVGEIDTDAAFQWCTDIEEIFDFSHDREPLYDLKHINHMITYYCCISGYQNRILCVDDANKSNTLVDTKFPVKVVFLRDYDECWNDDYDDWNYDGRLRFTWPSEVYGPKNSNVRGFSSGYYKGDVNIITVNAPEGVEGILINSRPTPKFAVSDGETVTFSLPQLPDDVRVFVNGEDMSSYIRNNTLAVTDVRTDLVLELYTPKFLEVQYDAESARVFIDGHEQSRINSDNKPHSVLVVPHDGYRIASLTLNDRDVTDKLVNRELTVPASQEAQVLVADIAGCSDARLAVESPEFRVAHYFNEGDNVLVDLTPPAGWLVNTVIFNDEDVTSALNADNHYQTPALLPDNVLQVSYVEDGTTGVGEVEAAAVKVFARGHSIIIANKPAGESVSVYNIKGEKIAETVEDEIRNLPHDIYIVHLESDRDYKLKI